MSIEARAEEISKSRWQMMHNCTQKAGAFGPSWAHSLTNLGPPEDGLGDMPGYCCGLYSNYVLTRTRYEIHNPVLDSQDGKDLKIIPHPNRVALSVFTPYKPVVPSSYVSLFLKIEGGECW
jgi:hypothetical protein